MRPFLAALLQHVVIHSNFVFQLLHANVQLAFREQGDEVLQLRLGMELFVRMHTATSNCINLFASLMSYSSVIPIVCR